MSSVNAALWVTKPFLDALDVHPAAQQQRGEMVPELMHHGAALDLGPVRYPGRRRAGTQIFERHWPARRR